MAHRMESSGQAGAQARAKGAEVPPSTSLGHSHLAALVDTQSGPQGAPCCTDAL